MYKSTNMPKMKDCICRLLTIKYGNLLKFILYHVHVHVLILVLVKLSVIWKLLFVFLDDLNCLL